MKLILHQLLSSVWFRFRRCAIFCPVFLAACSGTDDGATSGVESPVPAGKALATFQIQEGFKIELVAAEPLIADPVAMEIDENGNLYVVENHGYPLDKTRTSKIKLLRDHNGDGVMDEGVVFADSLLMPTGVMRWKKGILVTDAPDLLYLEDTDGDGKADLVEKVLSGFALSNPQHNVNTPIYGLDNWIYIGHERGVGSEVYKEEFGDEGDRIHFPAKPYTTALPKNANGRNVRVRPDTYELEMLASTTQYGHTFDAWGEHFLVNNSNHIMHSVVAAGYLTRNPKLLAATGTSYLSDHGNAAEVFPITAHPDRQLLTDVGVMTSACALTAYTGGCFPAPYHEDVTFVAEPVSNIVHADRLTHKASTFVASRMQTDAEFLASTDMWFRPVNLYVGPDGALYVVDYYREIIEHPEWLADDVIRSGQLYNGSDMGRIYRISASNVPQKSTTYEPGIADAPDTILVNKLSHPNLWWRRTAQRLLLDRDRQDRLPQPVETALLRLASQGHSALGRLHALWTLEGMQRLPDGVIGKALKDEHPGVRRNAIKIAEAHLLRNPSLSEKLMAMQDDADPKVRFQLLCTLGAVDSHQADSARTRLLFADFEDEFVQVAALSALSSPENLLKTVLMRYEKNVAAYASLVERLTAMVATGTSTPYTGKLLTSAIAPLPEDSLTWQLPMLKGVADAYRRSEAVLSPETQKQLFGAFFRHPALPVRQAVLEILQSVNFTDSRAVMPAMEHAKKTAADASAGEQQRALAIRFLALQNPAADSAFLMDFIVRGEAISLQLAALHALQVIPGETVTRFSLTHWPQLHAAVQDAALNTFLQKETRVKVLLDALESGKVEKSKLGWQRSIRLMTQRNVVLRNRARKFFTDDGQIRKVLEDYQKALKLKGTVEAGRRVFENHCAICHTVKGKSGIHFGPDLGTVQSWPASGIMANILNPNQSISHGYDLWNVELHNGKGLQGVITTETPSSLTLRNASGEVWTIARADIASMKALNMSAMPEAFEKKVTHQEMANLLAFLKNVR